MSRRIPKPHVPNSLLGQASRSTQSVSFLRTIQHSYYSSAPPKSRPTRVLITGGSRGIGLAIATAFSKTGTHAIQITGRTPSTLSLAVQSLQTTYKLSHPDITSENLSTLIKGTQADISSPSIWKTAFSTKEDGEKWDVPDILINSAGITHSSLLMAMKPSSIDEIIQTNLLGTIYACQAASKAMLRSKRLQVDDKEKGRGFCIINISSLLATHGGRGSSVYSASKAGVLGLTRALAAELGPSGIRVNAIVPGYIETAMTEAMDSTARSNALERIPLKRFGTAEEIAEAALFLASNEYANNCVINLDGGLSAAG